MEKEFISASDLLQAAADPNALPVEPIFIQPLNKWACVVGLSAVDRGRWENSFVKGRGDKRRVDPERAANARATLAVKCLVNNETERKRLFSDAEAAQLGKLPATILNPIYELAQRLCGVSDEDIDDLEKLSAGAGVSDSASS